MRKTEVLGIPLTDYTTRESMKKVDSFFKDGKVSTIALITMKGLLVAQNDESIKKWMSELDLTIPVDAEILRAGDNAIHSRIRDVENRVFGKEFFRKLVRQKKTVYLLSDNEANLQKMESEIKSIEKDVNIIGSFTLDSTEYGDDFVVNEINSQFADVLVSNLESPNRETFFEENHMKLNVAIWTMVRPDINHSLEKKGLLWKLHDHMVKKIFSLRTSRYQEEKAEEEAEKEMENEAESEMNSEIEK